MIFFVFQSSMLEAQHLRCGTLYAKTPPLDGWMSDPTHYSFLTLFLVLLCMGDLMDCYEQPSALFGGLPFSSAFWIYCAL